MLRYTISGWIGLIMNYSPFIVVPILAYRFDNWWFLFGIIFSILGSIVASKKYKFIILAIVSIAYLVFNNSVGQRQTLLFYFLSFLFGFVCMILYRIIGFGDKTSRALIATSGNKQARDDIEKELEIGMQKWRAEKANQKDIGNSKND